MPISTADLLLKFSTKVGAAGNANVGTPNASLGKYISTSQPVDNTSHNLFDIVTGDENVALESEYRCVFLHNAHATLTFTAAKVYLSLETAGGSNVTIGIDTTAATALASAAAQALEVVDENTAPVGVAFSAPTTIGTALLLGDLLPGQCRAIWIKRTNVNSAAQTGDGFTLAVVGESL